MHGGTPQRGDSGTGRTRRAILQAGALTGVSLGGFSSAVNAAGPEPPVRRSLESLRRDDPDDVLATFEEAIVTLRELPADDPRHWDALVKIHGTPTAFTDCEHGNWLFLPWHRAYLHTLEEVVREVTGNEAFALPYWNWFENRSLPAAFRGSADDPFVDPSRSEQSTLDASITGRERLESVLSDPNFFRVIGGWAGERDGVRVGSGGLEAPAHDYVHVRVGGNMARGSSPEDPAFWAHHAMLDRLWWEWNARGHPNLADEAWLGHAFEGHFVDRHGESVDVTIEDVLALPEAAYTYDARVDADGEGTDPSAQRATAEATLRTVEEVTLATDLEVAVADAPVTRAVDRATLEPVLTNEVPARVLLTAREVAMPETGPLNVRVHVGATNPDSTHSTEGDSFAGTFHWFVAPREHPNRHAFVDLSSVLAGLDERGELGETVPITLVGEELHGERAPAASVTVGSLAVSVTQSSVDGESRERPA